MTHDTKGSKSIGVTAVSANHSTIRCAFLTAGSGQCCTVCFLADVPDICLQLTLLHEQMKLFDLSGDDDDRKVSPFCWRIRLALAHKDLGFASVPWRAEEKDLIAFSGQGQVISYRLLLRTGANNLNECRV